MKRFIITTISIIALFVSSCENKWPKNGYLDGMWQVMKIKHNGDFVYVYDGDNPPGDKEIHYISFQLKLFELSNRGSQHMYYGYFERNDNTIRFNQISYNSRNENVSDDNVLVPDSLISSTIQPWGFYKNDNTFKIIKLTENDFIIENDSATIELIKF